MIINTEGVVISYIKYGESSIIAKIYTQEIGYGSFIVNSIRSTKSKKSIGLFQPFCLLDLIVYTKPSRDLQRISEFKNLFPIVSIHNHMAKSAIAMFLVEFLSKTLISETEPNTLLFEYFKRMVIDFERSEGKKIQNFHIHFLLSIGPYLGFAIQDFGTLFSSINKATPFGNYEEIIAKLIINDEAVQLSKEIRAQLLDALLAFYTHHLNLPKLKSVEVLRNILS